MPAAQILRSQGCNNYLREGLNNNDYKIRGWDIVGVHVGVCVHVRVCVCVCMLVCLCLCTNAQSHEQYRCTCIKYMHKLRATLEYYKHLLITMKGPLVPQLSLIYLPANRCSIRPDTITVLRSSDTFVIFMG